MKHDNEALKSTIRELLEVQPLSVAQLVQKTKASDPRVRTALLALKAKSKGEEPRPGVRGKKPTLWGLPAPRAKA